MRMSVDRPIGNRVARFWSTNCARIVMRNAQFGRPVAEPRLAPLLAGKCRPLAFDYARVSLAA